MEIEFRLSKMELLGLLESRYDAFASERAIAVDLVHASTVREITFLPTARAPLLTIQRRRARRKLTDILGLDSAIANIAASPDPVIYGGHAEFQRQFAEFWLDKGLDVLGIVVGPQKLTASRS